MGLGFLSRPGQGAEPASVSYQNDVLPIFEKKCIVCHACYDAPCQLKLTSIDGLVRGATDRAVYDGQRVGGMAPTRLFTDAHGEQEWQAMGFHGILPAASPDPEARRSLLYRMIELGRSHGLAEGEPVPEDIDLGLGRRHQCPAPDEFDKYARDYPRQGMPLAMAGLTDGEFTILKTWLEDGAPIDAREVVPSAGERAQVSVWEAFLNRPSKRNRLVARYLYEHWYLAHLYFEDAGTGHFFQLVRSHTPPGQPVRIVATVRPNGDPGDAFWYRFRLIDQTIVHKTHIVYAMSPARLQRVEELFLKSDWDISELPDYGAASAENPFATFVSIPAAARYRFLLDDAEYFVRSFIRGPVCRGQIATNVIDDHFYTFFQDPGHDLFVNDSGYMEEVTPFISLPGVETASNPLRYFRGRGEYIDRYERRYREQWPKGAGIETVWDGDGHHTGAALTIFRHFDNATVVPGLVGPVPKTLWVLDYPLLESTYYELVVNFNVFGPLIHQAETRLYFDLIRSVAENNFLNYMPAGQRQAIRSRWYRGSLAELKMHLLYRFGNEDIPSGLRYRGDDPKVEFVDRMRERLGAALVETYQPALLQAGNDLSSIAGRQASEDGMAFIDFMPEVVFLRIRSGSTVEAFTLIRNNAHTNVAFMFNEKIRREPDKDILVLYPGLLGSYPNFIFDLEGDEVKPFVDALRKVRCRDDFMKVVRRYGVRRMDPQIWDLASWFTRYLAEREPEQAGIYDMNRYLSEAGFPRRGEWPKLPWPNVLPEDFSFGKISLPDLRWPKVWRSEEN